MNNIKSIISAVFNLQLFSDGGASAGASAGDGADGGVNNGSGDQYEALGIPAKAKHIVNKLPNNKKAVETTNTQTNNKKAPTSEDTSQRKAFRDVIDEYGDEAKEFMNNAFSKRLSKYKGIEEENAKMKEILGLQNIRYGLDTESKSYLDDYMSAVQNDSKIFEDKAVEAGMTVDEYIKVQRAEQIIKDNDKREQLRKQNEVINNHIRNLVQQSEALKSEFPNLNIENELKNPQFKKLVDPPELGGIGMSVRNAFFALHNGDIMKATMSNAVNQAAISTANAVHTNKSRPSENGLSSVQAVTVKDNPANYKLEDFQRIRDEFRRTGARPKF